MRLRLAILACLSVWCFFMAFTVTHAHDEWANGNPVPSWVKSSCCGPEDVHHLTAKQVRAMKDGWHVDGLKQVIAYGKELPSQDGDYWAFFKVYADGSESPVYCFFAPAQSF